MSTSRDTSSYEEERSLMVGYGTFITKGAWKTKRNPKVCKVHHLRRVYDPNFAWFPFVVKDSTSEFLAVCFEVSPDDIVRLDRYEGVNGGLYERIRCEIEVKEADSTWTETLAWIYVPTSETKARPGFPLKDNKDRWLIEEIKTDDELRAEFPEFFIQ